MSAAILDLFKDHTDNYFVGDHLEISDAPRPPDGFDLVGFRLMFTYTSGPHAGTWRMSQPLEESDAIEAEVELRYMIPEGLVTQLRPVWGRTRSGRYQSVLTYDKVAVTKAYEAAKYFDYTARNNPENILGVLELHEQYVAQVQCTDYLFYEMQCREKNIAPLPCSNAWHDERFHS